MNESFLKVDSYIFFLVKKSRHVAAILLKIHFLSAEIDIRKFLFIFSVIFNLYLAILHKTLNFE